MSDFSKFPANESLRRTYVLYFSERRKEERGKNYGWGGGGVELVKTPVINESLFPSPPLTHLKIYCGPGVLFRNYFRT
jgi:hypothetical protein